MDAAFSNSMPLWKMQQERCQCNDSSSRRNMSRTGYTTAQPRNDYMFHDRTEFLQRCANCLVLAFLLTETTPPITELIFSHLVHQQTIYYRYLLCSILSLKFLQGRAAAKWEHKRERIITYRLLPHSSTTRSAPVQSNSESLLPENQSNVERNITPTELSRTLILLRKSLQLCYLSWKPPDRYIQTQCTRSHSAPTHCTPHPSFTAASLLLTYTEMRSNLNLYIK